MSDPAKPSDDQPVTPPAANPPADKPVIKLRPAQSVTNPGLPVPAAGDPTPATLPAQNPASPADGPASAGTEPAETTPVAPETGPSAEPAADPGTPKPPAYIPPVDYAMPTRKSWLPTPALIKNLGCIFKMLFGFTVMLLIGYVMLMAMNPKARQWALQGSKPGAGGGFPGTGGSGGGSGIGGGKGPTPFKALNQVLAIPAQALGKTDDVVKANNARAGLLDGVIADEEGRAKKGAAGSRTVVNPFLDAANSAAAAAGKAGAPNAKAPAGAEDAAEQARAANAARLLALQEKLTALPTDPVTGEPLPAPAPVRPTAIVIDEPEVLPPVTLPGGIVISSASPDGAPAATRTFLYWVVNLNIGGILPNPPPRILLNGRLTYEQQEVHLPLGIVFDHLDADRKLLFFRDKTGAFVTRSY